MKPSHRQFLGECLRKKKLKEEWADQIIKKAKKEGTALFKYFCRHCQNWHVTKQDQSLRPLPEFPPPPK